MKILKFTGGLGNQIFEYATYVYFKNKYPKEHIYIYCDEQVYGVHNGLLEVAEYFDATLPKPPAWVEYLWKLFSLYCRYTGYKLWDEHTPALIKDERQVFMYAYHPDNRYIPTDRHWLRFKTLRLSERNIEALDRIKTSDSVFVHVRRGDYTLPCNVKRYGAICTEEYYAKAIRMMTERHPKAQFFVFSDDMPWTRRHLPKLLADVTFIDWNKGRDSYLDMYLMSHCKAAIIANSTFSYWGARLGEKKDVIYPKKWLNASFGAFDIFEDDWQGIT